MKKKNRKVSLNYVKNEFNFVALTLLLYALLIAYLPFMLLQYANVTVGTHPTLNDISIRIAYLYIIVIFGTFIPFFILMKHERFRFRDIWAECNFGFKDIFTNAVVFTAVGTLMIFVSSIINNYFHIGNSLIIPIGLPHSPAMLKEPLYLFLCIVATPILEEFAFRGVLLKGLGRFGYYFAMIASSVIFGVFHGAYSEMLPAFVLGIFLSQIVLRYRSIQPAVIVHILYQAIVFGLELIPETHYYVTAGIILGIYLLALLLIMSKQFRFAKIHKRYNAKTVSLIFFTRFAIIFVIIIMLVFAFLNTSAFAALKLPIA